MKLNRKDLTLYAVTDSSHGNTLYNKVKLALMGAPPLGGVTMVQLRDKELTGDALLQEARTIRRLCGEFKVPFIINDYVELALAVDADGVHVGQDDMDVAAARAMLGSDKIIGATAHTVQQALAAQRQGADYIGAGAAFATTTKSDTTVIGTHGIGEICAAVTVPVVAIGGIGESNIKELYGTRVSGVAVVSALFSAEDIPSAAGRLRAAADRLC